jgi:hypothetical protein
MPIVVEGVTVEQYQAWLAAQASPYTPMPLRNLLSPLKPTIA